MKEPINKITLKDGSVRYRLVVDIGRDENGRRKQLTRTFDTRATPATNCRGPARDEPGNLRQAVQGDGQRLPGRLPQGRNSGCAPPPSGTTKTPCGRSANAWRHARSSRITKADVEDLMDWMLTAAAGEAASQDRPVWPDGPAHARTAQRRAGGSRPGRQARPQRGQACQAA